MVWNILLSAAISLAVGAAVGYGVAKIIDALSARFAQFWRNIVAATQEIFGYVSEATQYYLATIAQQLDQHWPQIENYLRKEIGYRREWLVAIFHHGLEKYLAFGDPIAPEERSRLFSLGQVQNHAEVQLPTVQNPVYTVLTLS